MGLAKAPRGIDLHTVACRLQAGLYSATGVESGACVCGGGPEGMRWAYCNLWYIFIAPFLPEGSVFLIALPSTSPSFLPPHTPPLRLSAGSPRGRRAAVLRAVAVSARAPATRL